MSDRWEIINGDCVDIVRGMEADSVDAIITDPPYGLKFMGKGWDDMGHGSEQQAWHYRWAVEALRVLKPGGHLLAFGGTRTYHRLASAIEDAGFEIRDQIQWLYGTGFPKSHNISKAIDKAKTNDLKEIYEITAWIRETRDAAGLSNRDIDTHFGMNGMAGCHWTSSASQPAVPTLEQWPELLAFLGVEEPPARIQKLAARIIKPKGEPGEAWHKREKTGESDNGIAGGTGEHAGNADAYGFAGSYDITESHLTEAIEWEGWGTALKPAHEPIVLARKPFTGTVAMNVLEWGTGGLNIDATRIEPEDRWPANVILDEEAGARLDEQSSGVSHFFYCPKASKAEREAGLEASGGKRANTHPTVKPIALMAYLVRLVTPPGGLILDPFSGTGTTGIAALQEGFRYVGIELDEGYAELSEKRIAHRLGLYQ